jgi:hypothetical protein
MSKQARMTRRDELRAAAQARERHARRMRLGLAAGATGLVLLLVVTLVVLKVAGGGDDGSGVVANRDADPVVQALAALPASTLDAVGRGSDTTLPRAIAGQPALTADGKPLVLYVGAEYCPFCAAQRWPLIVALSRFGTFSGLTISHSASDDIYPDTATLSFHGASYRSQYLAFQGVEMMTNVREGSGYTALDRLSAAQEQNLRTYNAPPFISADQAGAIPFLNLGNRYLATGSAFSPELLAGKSAEQIAAALADPNSALAKAIGGAANGFTAQLCRLTGGQPGAVCSSPAVTAHGGSV